MRPCLRPRAQGLAGWGVASTIRLSASHTRTPWDYSLRVHGITASDRHERMLLERLQDAAARLERAETEVRVAREVRDGAVRAAVHAGVPSGVVAREAGVSGGLVSRIVNAPRRP